MADDHSELVPPLPIPNRTVKRFRADDSAATSVKVGYRQACYTQIPVSLRWRGFLLVRPAWAQSWRWKSSRKLTTANEVKRNCGRATDCGKEVWIETASRWTRTGYEALPIRASGQATAKLLWSRIRRRKFGGCAGKDCVLTWGYLASCLKGRRRKLEREVSRGHSSRRLGWEGRNRRRRVKGAEG